MKELKISSKDMIMVDDLKPGKDMADSCNVDFVGVGWAFYTYNYEFHEK